MAAFINFAHRGASGAAPENTMAAFHKALEQGANGIETDVQMTSDHKLVLMHDEAVNRTTNGQGYIKDYTLSELQQLDAGSWFSEAFKGEQVPELKQLLALGKARGTFINIELKNGIIPYPGLEEEVIAAVREYGMEERVIISSFNHYSLVHCKKLAPDIVTAILYMEGLYQVCDYAQTVGADALHAFKYAVLPELVAEARDRGLAYHPFTVNAPDEMKRLLKAGVSGIITDYPDVLHALLQQEEV
ncbi:glycerophosphodiester phosphodiesterase [Paenibacillus sp. F411]|uniref:glycerophosphodiester phosphodiesterase n=1 Tax=Paenibacillus sp. F411 TaxID=2820239 RepID=UPI001AB0128C|nr:glycerophosphodiester phosphodiesterase [Paenibacillus sp. F411]MBO2942720.1 glycerophosphodiester phosphodiesterase [Paenibacillus sp. F411]